MVTAKAIREKYSLDFIDGDRIISPNQLDAILAVVGAAQRSTDDCETNCMCDLCMGIAAALDALNDAFPELQEKPKPTMVEVWGIMGSTRRFRTKEEATEAAVSPMTMTPEQYRAVFGEEPPG